jgi:hypothetical protein
MSQASAEAADIISCDTLADQSSPARSDEGEIDYHPLGRGGSESPLDPDRYLRLPRRLSCRTAAIGIYLEVLASPEAVEAAGACDAQITPGITSTPDSTVPSSRLGAVIVANSLSPSLKMLASSTWPGYGTPAKRAP